MGLLSISGRLLSSEGKLHSVKGMSAKNDGWVGVDWRDRRRWAGVRFAGEELLPAPKPLKMLSGDMMLDGRRRVCILDGVKLATDALSSISSLSFGPVPREDFRDM